MLLNCSVREDSWESLGLQEDQTSQSERKSVLNNHWKDWWWSWNSNNFGHMMGRADSLEETLMLGKTEGRRRRGWQRMRWLDDITDSMDMNLSKFQELAMDREACHAAVYGVTKSLTWPSDQTDWLTEPVLERMWGKGNLHALLVAMKTDKATMENSMEISQKLKNKTTKKWHKWTYI